MQQAISCLLVYQMSSGIKMDRSNIEKALNKSKKFIKTPEYSETMQTAEYNNSKAQNHLVMSETHKTFFFLSLYGTNESEGCEVVTGAINTNQTTVCQIDLKEPKLQNHSEFLPDHRNYDDNRFETILQYLIILCKCHEEIVKKEKAFQLIKILLNAMSDGESALLVIDDTQNIFLPLIEQTTILSRMDAEKGKLLNVIILERNKRIQSLHSPQLKQTYQSVFDRQKPDRLRIEEIIENIENSLTMNGPKKKICFSNEALTFIRNNSLGISHMANLMLENTHLRLRSKKVEDEKEEIAKNKVENLRFHEGGRESEGERKLFVRDEPEEKPLHKPKELKKIYLIGFGILAIIIAGVVIYISGRTWQTLTMFNLDFNQESHQNAQDENQLAGKTGEHRNY